MPLQGNLLCLPSIGQRPNTQFPTLLSGRSSLNPTIRPPVSDFISHESKWRALEINDLGPVSVSNFIT
jgi:hypothetical protein